TGGDTIHMRTLAMMKRIILQFKRDKRSLALLFIAPLFVLTLLWVVLDMEDYEPTLAMTDVPDNMQSVLEDVDHVNLKVMNTQEADEALEKNEVDAHLQWHRDKPELTMEGSDPTATKAVKGVIDQASKQ